MMECESLDPRRRQLCGRNNAERLALRLSEATGEDHAVVRSECPLQPLRVMPSHGHDPATFELQVILL